MDKAAQRHPLASLPPMPYGTQRHWPIKKTFRGVRELQIIFPHACIVTNFRNLNKNVISQTDL